MRFAGPEPLHPRMFPLSIKNLSETVFLLAHNREQATTASPRRYWQRAIPLLVGLFSFSLAAAALAADFTVTSPGFYYSINGQQPNPTLTLMQGRTYTFDISTSAVHPFEILSSGVQNNNISSGTITYTVPTVASNYNYICSIHLFGAQILTVPPSPPTVEILSFSAQSNLVLRSAAPSGWTVFPEYSTNLAGTNWFALTVLTNSSNGGTNDTICGRPEGAPVFIRVRATGN